MTDGNDIEARFAQARQLHGQSRFMEAEAAYRELADEKSHRERVLSALADLYMHSGQPREAVSTLVTLTQEYPDRFLHCARLANVLHSAGESRAAIEQYTRFLERYPEQANAYFNLALLYKAELRFVDAIEAYEDALRRGIDNVQEVYSNMGVLYSQLRRMDKAKQMYERALSHDASYVPALFNLAGLYEELGERQQAVVLYERILAAEPQHHESRARLIHCRKTTDQDRARLDGLRSAIDAAHDDPLGQETLYFALGKALDDLGEYEQALAAYTSANELGKRRSPPYDRAATEQAFDGLIELFDAELIERLSSSETATPVFVCGMFRSGSTLLEQMLAAHPDVTSAGELDFIPWLAARNVTPYPQGIRSVDAERIGQMAQDYMSRLRSMFPDARTITDKRPDNVIHLGLIRCMFPAARMVYTRRSRPDTCLSVYFQQFGGGLGYTCDLHDAAHYYAQQERLVAHWQTCFGANIFTADYDDLVRGPDAVLRELLGFLELPWDDRVLDFQNAGHAVKTASLWQVRDQLHTGSSGRWRHYEKFIPNVGDLLQAQD